MGPTTILMNEHRVIEQVLNCLEVIAEQCSREGRLDVKSAEMALDFLRNFADRCHHGKEEDYLFVMLEEKGIPRQYGPTGVMLAEHHQGRAHVRGMATELADARKDDPYAIQRFAQHARSFVALLRQHIQKEDLRLFPMADEKLSKADQETLWASFREVHSEKLEPDIHQKYVRIADELAERFGVPRVTTDVSLDLE